MRRVRPTPLAAGVFTAAGYHAFVTDRPVSWSTSRPTTRRHAVVGQTIAELKAAGPAHLPFGTFMAVNAAWLALAVMTHNLALVVGILATCTD